MRLRLTLACCAAIAVSGCSSVPDEPASTADVQDEAFADDAGLGDTRGVADADAESDTAAAGDVGTSDGADTVTADTAAQDALDVPDTTAPGCAPLAPAFGESDAAVEFAANAARCGQDDFALVAPDEMGAILEVHDGVRFPAPILTAVLTAAEIATHRPPQHDVELKVVSYRTQDRGRPTRATAAVAYPVGLSSDSAPIALVLHGTSGFTDSCAVSEIPQWQALVALFASWGYIAVAPDYIGLRAAGPASEGFHPYLVGQAAAIGSLDAVRAGVRVTRDEVPDLCPSPRTLVWGASQGGHAAVWVDRLAPTYAAELDIVGVAAAIPPTDVAAHTVRGLTSVVGGSGPVLGFFALAPDWYGYRDRRGEVFHADLVETIDTILGTPCGEPRPPSPVELDDPTAVFADGFVAAAREGVLPALDPWWCLVKENDPTRATVPPADHGDDFGLLVITGELDELVYTPIERDAWVGVCESGVNTAYLECAGADHVEGGAWSFPEVGRFFDARAAGEPFEGSATCVPPAPVTCEGEL